MKFIKLFEEHNILYNESWKKYLPQSFTFIKGNKKYTRYQTNNIIKNADMVQIIYGTKGEKWGEPEDLQFDLYFVMDGTIRIDIDITFGDLVVSEFSVESPDKVKVVEYTSYNSKFDPSNSVFAFTEESIQQLIKLLNSLDDRLSLTRNNFNFLDSNPHNYKPN
jgi:hypothetical protein